MNVDQKNKVLVRTAVLVSCRARVLELSRFSSPCSSHPHEHASLFRLDWTDYEHLLYAISGLSQFWPYIKEALPTVSSFSKAPVQQHSQRTLASQFRKRFMFVSKIRKVKEVKVS